MAELQKIMVPMPLVYRAAHAACMCERDWPDTFCSSIRVHHNAHTHLT